MCQIHRLVVMAHGQFADGRWSIQIHTIQALHQTMPPGKGHQRLAVLSVLSTLPRIDGLEMVLQSYSQLRASIIIHLQWGNSCLKTRTLCK